MNPELSVKILLVEDDEDDQLIIRDYLSDTSLNYEIVWAKNYDQFLTCIQTISPDLVITDYLLGSTSGLEVLKKAKEKAPLVPVMILTGKGNTSIDIEAMKLGAADYLIKGSFDSSSLERAVRYAIERASSVKILKENEHYQNLIRKLASTDRIARMIAHEVKNPLTNILLCTDQIKDSFGENDDLLSYIEIITRNSTRINKLLSDLLDSTRFGDIKLEKKNLVEVIRNTLSLAGDRIRLKGIVLKEDYSHSLVEMELDEEKISLALLNIIINAVEAMDEKEGGIIEIKLRKEDHKTTIHIRDNGPGMVQETRERLFEPFFTSKSKGTGLGLASAQNIILGHKGKIEVKSEVDLGSEFVISFLQD